MWQWDVQSVSAMSSAVSSAKDLLLVNEYSISS